MTAPATMSRADAAVELLAGLRGRRLTCGVVGLGLVGTLIAEGLAEAGFRVVGYDLAEEAVARFAGADADIDPVVLANAAVLVVSIRVKPGGRELDAVGGMLEMLPPRPRLLVVASTMRVGATRAFAKRWAAGEATFVAHAPERVQADHGRLDAQAIPHLVAGVDQPSLELGTQLLETYCDDVRQVSSVEVSELSKLLENAFRTINIALIAEVTKIAHSAGVSAAEVTDAAATKPFGYFPFSTGPGVGGHCLPNDLELLSASAAARTPFLDATRSLIDEMPVVAVERLAAILPLTGATILVVGTGFKAGSAQQTATPAAGIVRELRRRGAAPSYFDSQNTMFTVDAIDVPPARLDATTFDAAIVVSGDALLDGEALRRAASVVLDASGGAVDGAIRL